MIYFNEKCVVLPYINIQHLPNQLDCDDNYYDVYDAIKLMMSSNDNLTSDNFAIVSLKTWFLNCSLVWLLDLDKDDGEEIVNSLVGDEGYVIIYIKSKDIEFRKKLLEAWES